jgi:hypothetical protein
MKNNTEDQPAAKDQADGPLPRTPCSTLADALPKEIERCQDLIGIYKSLGPVGMFGHAAISADIAAAHRAMMEGDLPAMIQAYEALKRCE